MDDNAIAIIIVLLAVIIGQMFYIAALQDKGCKK